MYKELWFELNEVYCHLNLKTYQSIIPLISLQLCRLHSNNCIIYSANALGKFLILGMNTKIMTSSKILSTHTHAHRHNKHTHTHVYTHTHTHTHVYTHTHKLLCSRMSKCSCWTQSCYLIPQFVLGGDGSFQHHKFWFENVKK